MIAEMDDRNTPLHPFSEKKKKKNTTGSSGPRWNRGRSGASFFGVCIFALSDCECLGAQGQNAFWKSHNKDPLWESVAFWLSILIFQ